MTHQGTIGTLRSAMATLQGENDALVKSVTVLGEESMERLNRQTAIEGENSTLQAELKQSRENVELIRNELTLLKARLGETEALRAGEQQDHQKILEALQTELAGERLRLASESAAALQRAVDDAAAASALAMQERTAALQEEASAREEAELQLRRAQRECESLRASQTGMQAEHDLKVATLIAQLDELSGKVRDESANYAAALRRVEDCLAEAAGREESLAAEKTALLQQMTQQRTATAAMEESLAKADRLRRSAEATLAAAIEEMDAERAGMGTLQTSHDLLLCAARGELDSERRRHRQCSEEKTLLEGQLRDILNHRGGGDGGGDSTRPDYYTEIVATIERTTTTLTDRDRQLRECQQTISDLRRQLDAAGNAAFLKSQLAALPVADGASVDSPNTNGSALHM